MQKFSGEGTPPPQTPPPLCFDLRATALKLNVTPPEKNPSYGLDNNNNRIKLQRLHHQKRVAPNSPDYNPLDYHVWGQCWRVEKSYHHRAISCLKLRILP